MKFTVRISLLRGASDGELGELLQVIGVGYSPALLRLKLAVRGVERWKRREQGAPGDLEISLADLPTSAERERLALVGAALVGRGLALNGVGNDILAGVERLMRELGEVDLYLAALNRAAAARGSRFAAMKAAEWR